VGAIVAPLSGRLADRHGPRGVVICGTATVLASFALFGTFGRISLIGITVGVLILDIGVSLAMTANQSRVYALRPEARSRLNTVYMTGAFALGVVPNVARNDTMKLDGFSYPTV
jgi:MFS family permease